MLAAVSSTANRVGMASDFNRDISPLNAEAAAFRPRQIHLSPESSNLLRRRAQRSAELSALNMQHLATAVECARRAIESAGPTTPSHDLMGLHSFDPAVRRPLTRPAFEFPSVQPAPSSPFLRMSPSPRTSNDANFPWPSLALFGPNALNGSGRSLDGCLDELVRNELNFSDRLAKPFMSQHRNPNSPCPFRVHNQDSVWNPPGQMTADMGRSFADGRTRQSPHQAHRSARSSSSSDDSTKQPAAAVYARDGAKLDPLSGDDAQPKDKDQLERERRLYRMHQRLSRMWRHEQQALQWHWVASTYRQFATILMAQQQQQQQQQALKQQQHNHQQQQQQTQGQAWSTGEQAAAAESEGGESRPRARRRYRRRRRRRNNQHKAGAEEEEGDENVNRGVSGAGSPEEDALNELSVYCL